MSISILILILIQRPNISDISVSSKELLSLNLKIKYNYMSYRHDPTRVKRRLNISSLNAAICNVAVFKSMKEREFRDEIHISYCEEGVLLEAASNEEWQRANRYVQNFLASKRIALLAFGFEKEVYEQLIIKGLKDYTRRMKDMGEECPYINIIHYQKLRKSCEYMDKERYLQPLKDWQRKNKRNPNFAFLIVEPIHKYEDVKRRLLQYLLKKELIMNEYHLSLLYFILLCFTSAVKQDLREGFEKTYIEMILQRTRDKNWRNENGEFEEYRVRVVNYTPVKLGDLDYKIVKSSKNLSRLGLQFIQGKQLQAHCKKTKQFLNGSTVNSKGESIAITVPFDMMLAELSRKYGQDFCIIPFKKNQREKYLAVIDKFINKTQQKNITEIAQQIDKHILCEYEQIQFLGEIFADGAEERGYRIQRVCLNDCPYMVHVYPHVPLAEIDSFLLYLDQLRIYACTYLVRFYGMAVQYDRSNSHKVMPADMSLQQKLQGNSYYLIFDYHHRTLKQMADNDMILDNFQVAQMVLQLVYLINFLHTHEEPRSLGEVKVDEVYWPMRMVLPFLRSEERVNRRQVKQGRGHFRAVGQGFQGDVRLAGLFMKVLLESGADVEAEEEDDHFTAILQSMLKQNKYDRITLAKSMTTLEEMLMLN